MITEGFLFCLVFSVACSGQSIEEPLAEFLTSLQLYLGTRSIILYEPFHTAVREENKNLMKQLSSLFQTTVVLCTESDHLFQWKNERSLVFYSHVGKTCNLTNAFQFFNNIQTQDQNIWLILGETLDIKSLENVYIPFDCQFFVAEYNPTSKMYKLMEIYKTDSKSILIRADFGIWHEDKLMTEAPFGLFTRRDNFNRSRVNVRPQYDHADGIFARVNTFYFTNWESIGIRLNFESIYVNETDKNYEVDIASNGFRVGVDNSDHVLPFLQIDVDLFYREPNELLVWDKYLQPFTGTLWFTVLIWMAVSTSLMVICVKYTTFFDDSQIIRGLHLLYDSFFILIQNGSEVCSFSLSVRTLCYLELLTSLVLYAAYSAVFISFVTVITTTVPFTTLEGVLENGQYNIILVRTKAYPYVKANPHPTFKALFKDFVVPEDRLGNSFDGNFYRMCETDEKLMAELPKQNIGILRGRLSCRIGKSSVPLLRIQSSWLFSANSHFQDIIRVWSWKLREAGTLSSVLLWRRDFLEKTFDEMEIAMPESIELLEVTPLLVVLLVGIILALIALSLEIIVIGSRKNNISCKRLSWFV